MKVKKLKLIGAISASIALLTSSVTSMTAFADVSPVPGSSFLYDFTASVVTKQMTVMNKQVNPGDVEITLQITNNPGIQTCTFNMYYGEGYEFISLDESNNGFKNTYPVANEKDNCLVYVGLSEKTDIFGNDALNYNNFCVKFYFRATDIITKDNANFSIGLTQYVFPLENKESDGLSLVTDVTISNPYMIGDFNNDGYITMGDASSIDSLGAKANAFLHDTSVEVINDNLFTEQWRKWFPKLRCAEVADADENGFVNNDDTQEVVDYYAHNGAGVPMESLVGKTRFKTIYFT